MSGTFGNIVSNQEGLVETFLRSVQSSEFLFRLLCSPIAFLDFQGALLVPFVYLFRQKLSTRTKDGVLIALVAWRFL